MFIQLSSALLFLGSLTLLCTSHARFCQSSLSEPDTTLLCHPHVFHSTSCTVDALCHVSSNVQSPCERVGNSDSTLGALHAQLWILAVFGPQILPKATVFLNHGSIFLALVSFAGAAQKERVEISWQVRQRYNQISWPTQHLESMRLNP